MKVELIQVEPIALLPTQAGCAVFLGDGKKVIVFYIEPGIGASINAVLAGQKPPRPLTHDLFAQVLEAFGATVTHVVISKVEDEIFYAHLHLSAQNEIMEKKIIEADARPSDCIALAVRQDAPIMFVKSVWEAQPDMSHVLEELRKQGMSDEGEDIPF
ncbi:bifunctional nuclease family protein [Roseibacillus ishigakijimensis]|uniref:Bifunctional nuclease family protein n=1 Tax=Roseibacillus ishigakijimensis TaxID=454146 RepID=A0A934RMN2_9BACT|nr:bifunctional nuclease family protein [Roseibacillus ishigakijimensis]MBK1832452.1 bifunctional nuclease family protein [Roseibacillus ishigakijimensis]